MWISCGQGGFFNPKDWLLKIFKKGKIKSMVFVWDYDIEKLKKSKRGRLLLLERQINGGVYLSDKEKLPLQEVKKNWNKFQIDPAKRRLLKMLIWKK